MVSSWLSQESALALYTLSRSFALVLPSLTLVVGNIVPPFIPARAYQHDDGIV